MKKRQELLDLIKKMVEIGEFTPQEIFCGEGYADHQMTMNLMFVQSLVVIGDFTKEEIFPSGK